MTENETDLMALATSAQKLALLRREEIDKLKAENAELKSELCAARDLLRDAWSDIWQTVRANQTNLNGRDPNFPNDEPCAECIGKNVIHQAGIDASKRLHARIHEYMGQLWERWHLPARHEIEAAEAAKEGE